MQNSKFHLISLGQSFPWSFLFPAGPGAVCILPVPPAGWPKGSARPKPSLWGEGAAAYAATDEGPSFSRPSRGRRICQRCSALRGDGNDTHPTGRSASSRLYFSPPGNFFPLPPSNRVKDGRVSRHYGAVPHRPYQKSKEGSYETRLDLLKTARQEGEGTLLSPLSAALALSMAANGADGETLDQFREVLGDGASLEALNVSCSALMKLYGGLGGSTECSIANSLWTDPEGRMQEDFVGRCSGIFDAQVFQEDLSAPVIVPALNSWVSDHTAGMIPQIIQRPFGEDAAALMVNALYLKNTWATKFDPSDTVTRDFTRADGTAEPLDFLQHFSRSLTYLQSGSDEGVLLPYDDGRLAFFALMPRQSSGVPDFERWLSSLTGEGLSALLSGREETFFLRLSLPKFEQEWSGELKDALAALGLTDAFDPDLADFSLLGDDPRGYYLSQVIHAARIEVNEEGTEAAAATVVAAASGAAPPQEGVTLIFDRPFLYGIVDLQNGVPLFLGTFEGL